MQAVNLLPRQTDETGAKKTARNPVTLVAAIGGGAVLLVLVVGFLVAGRSVDHQRAALDRAKAELAVTPEQKGSPQRNAMRAALASDRDRRAFALASALGKRVSWDRVLRRIALVLPDDVWLGSLSGTTPLTTPTTAAPTTSTAPTAIPATPSGLTIGGYTYSQDAVARLLSRLQVIPDLKNVQLQTSKVDEVGGQKVVQFTILADVNGGDAS
jgi:Tfp pilus assembly protein PilN